MPQDTQESDWIEWQGGSRPVDPNVQVEVQFRGESALLRKPLGSASAFDWRHFRTGDEPYDGDIIAYRVVSK